MMKDLAQIRELEVRHILGELLILVRGLSVTACLRDLPHANSLSAVVYVINYPDVHYAISLTSLYNRLS